MLGDRLPARRGQLVHVLEDSLERAVGGDQLRRGLVADSRDAGDVVGGIALQADEVGHLVGRDPQPRLDALGRVDVHIRDTARGHHQADVVGDELEGIAVGRDDACPDRGLVRPGGERGDHVVGFPALELEVAVAEGLDDRPEERELLPEEIRHRPAVLLVLGRELRPVHGPRVPRHRDPLGPVVGEQLEQHVREPEQRAGGEAFARRQLLRQGEERPVGEVVAVDEEQLAFAGGRVVELELGPAERLRGHGATLSSRADGPGPASLRLAAGRGRRRRGRGRDRTATAAPRGDRRRRRSRSRRAPLPARRRLAGDDRPARRPRDHPGRAARPAASRLAPRPAAGRARRRVRRARASRRPQRPADDPRRRRARPPPGQADGREPRHAGVRAAVPRRRRRPRHRGPGPRRSRLERGRPATGRSRPGGDRRGRHRRRRADRAARRACIAARGVGRGHGARRLGRLSARSSFGAGVGPGRRARAYARAPGPAHRCLADARPPAAVRSPTRLPV